jgi:hypothetical protein
MVLHSFHRLKWQSGSPFEDSIRYIMECPLHQNENFKVKCKGHNFFFVPIKRRNDTNDVRTAFA